MGVMASQITNITIFHSTVYSDAVQRKHLSSASLAFVRGIHRGPVNSPHKWPVTRKMFPFHDVIMSCIISISCFINHRSPSPWRLMNAMPLRSVPTVVCSGWQNRKHENCTLLRKAHVIIAKKFTSPTRHVHQPGLSFDLVWRHLGSVFQPNHDAFIVQMASNAENVSISWRHHELYHINKLFYKPPVPITVTSHERHASQISANSCLFRLTKQKTRKLHKMRKAHVIIAKKFTSPTRHVHQPGLSFDLVWRHLGSVFQPNHDAFIVFHPSRWYGWRDSGGPSPGPLRWDRPRERPRVAGKNPHKILPRRWEFDWRALSDWKPRLIPTLQSLMVRCQSRYVHWWLWLHVDGLLQDCSNSIALELLQSCTKPSMWRYELAAYKNTDWAPSQYKDGLSRYGGLPL